MSSYDYSINFNAETDRGEADEVDRRRMLAERAQLGDTEAFGELIEQHRSKAKMWAERMTGDPHMADDIVQDALIRAFLHIGSLHDTSRFLPWLHKIVRNQANMRLRRGGPYKREKPFAAFGLPDSEADSVDWDDLDSVLFHLTRTAANAAKNVHDPAESLMRKELYETIHSVLNCLNRKERDIFEAYFFKQLSPDEIAAMYQMTTGSIYTYIHRSRQKLRQEHIRVSLGLLPDKGGMALVKSRLLPLPEWPASDAVMQSFVDRIGHLLAAIGDKRETAELMGLSGFAFRIQISDKTTFADGIYMFDWRRTLMSFMQELGYEVSLLCGQLADSPVPLLGAVERFPVVLPIEEAVIPFIRRAIDAGKPVIYFDTTASRPYVHEWSLIYGYDDEKRTVRLTDVMKPDGKTLTYEDIALNPVRFLASVNRIEESVKLPALHARDAARRHMAEVSIRRAVEHAKNPRAYCPMTAYLSYTSGLSAYDRWIRHMRGDPAIPPNRYGVGQLAAVYAQARSYAARYLRGVPLQGEAMRFALLASEAYEQAGEALGEFSAAVPFMRTAEVLSPEHCEKCAVWLEQAKAFEAAAIGYLEKAVDQLEKGKSL
ncbi:sigma-70 family RNA polymerase sigma factor [Paenibacillus antri]|uniref:RNA polymerase sigma factor n=1 Tax=Paenibacillus antri TaxID=2582848 RepID=A0A5R9GEC4_9BACL|nr:sigma-70 family RNA polymerase sigma factor [Paenibacillus antri]TLS52460.1 sigma-70 family RNA polymerase sigma factor [Paenibacillus antri]